MRVDFYLLKTDQLNECHLLACRLLEKAYLLGHQVFVLCSNEQEALTIDETLWTFKENSFIPHNLQGEGPEPPPAIQIGFDSLNPPRGFNDMLLNLSPIVPAFYNRFKRIAEIVLNSEDAKSISRAHYRFYRDQKSVLHTHEI